MASIQAGTLRHDVGSAASERPVAPSDRIVAIDAVRGIALFGVMAINVVTEFRVSIFEQFLPAESGGSWLDHTLSWILTVGIELKAFALFSLLFGIGLAIQYDHLAGNPHRAVLLVRRLAFLMIMGAIHLVLIWNGDILLEYAIAGFVVLPLLAFTRTLSVAGIALLALFIAAPFLPPIATLPSHAWMFQHIADATRVYGSGDFAAVLSFRIHELPAILPLHEFIFPRTVALMLLGAAIWRAGFFSAASQPSRYLPLVASIGILIGGALSASLQNEWLALDWRGALSLERLSTILLACSYGAAIVWTASQARLRRSVVWAAPLGRMAFTCYLMQSLIFGWLFYGYGLGLFGGIGVTAALAIGTSVYLLQVAFASFWLRRYAYGPLEWIWRSAMYGTWQRLRLA